MSEKTLEAKLKQIEDYIAQKQCVGLKIESDNCEGCHLSEICQECVIERLILEERKLEESEHHEDVDSEIKVMDAERVDWGAMAKTIVGLRPSSLDVAVDAIKPMLPMALASSARQYLGVLLSKLSEKGLLTFDESNLSWS